MRARIFLSFAALVATPALAHDRAAHAPTGTPAVFKQLASVVGEWTGEQDGQPVKVTYTLTGDGSAVMETMAPVNFPGATMITMFTADGDRLIATHYCAAHNQPQMTALHPSDLAKGAAFRLTRITGMKSPADWHNTGLTFVLDDANHITQHWTYAYKGKTGSNTFHYTRVGQ
jgi:hypothetical protein